MRTLNRFGRPLALSTIFAMQRVRLEEKFETSLRRIADARAAARADTDLYDLTVRGIHGGRGGVSNARLIAAAPELLAACKALVDGEDDVPVMDLARAAIAKAEPR